jgi:hypothetical protein
LDYFRCYRYIHMYLHMYSNNLIKDGAWI